MLSLLPQKAFKQFQFYSKTKLADRLLLKTDCELGADNIIKSNVIVTNPQTWFSPANWWQFGTDQMEFQFSLLDHSMTRNILLLLLVPAQSILSPWTSPQLFGMRTWNNKSWGWKHRNWELVNVQEQARGWVLQEQLHPWWAAEQGTGGQCPAHLLHRRCQRILELGEGHREGELGQHGGQVVTPELTGEGICQGRVPAGERQRHTSAL